MVGSKRKMKMFSYSPVDLKKGLYSNKCRKTNLIT